MYSFNRQYNYIFLFSNIFYVTHLYSLEFPLRSSLTMARITCVFAFACLIFANFSTGLTTDDCPASLPRDSYLRTFRSSCYYFQLQHPQEFAGAESECASRHGHLAVINDMAENTFIYNTVLTDFHLNTDVWIGLSDRQIEGHFVWVDGSEPQFTYWASGKPEGVLLGSMEDCVVMEITTRGHWNDKPCSGLGIMLGTIMESRYFVCEYPVVLTTATTTTTIATTTPETTARTTHSSLSHDELCRRQVLPDTGNHGIGCVSDGCCQFHVQSHQFCTGDQVCCFTSNICTTTTTPTTTTTALTGDELCRRQILPDTGNHGIGCVSDGCCQFHVQSNQFCTGGQVCCFTTDMCTTVALTTTTTTTTTTTPATTPTTTPTAVNAGVGGNCLLPDHDQCATLPAVCQDASLSHQLCPHLCGFCGSSCLQCGDYNNSVPCTEVELETTQSTVCGQSGLNYCMTDISKTSAGSSLTIYKRCVNEAECLKDYFVHSISTDYVYCQHLDNAIPDIFSCHLCCHGDACNSGLVPDPSTLYLPSMG